MKNAFVGFDAEGDACIYVQRLGADGESTGDFLEEEELEAICEQLNEQFEHVIDDDDVRPAVSDAISEQIQKEEQS
jgi:hypothetical protein